MKENLCTADGQIRCITPRLDVEDVGSLILFIDMFLQYVDKSDKDSRDSAANVFRVRQKLHQSLPFELAEEIPQGVDPCLS